MGKIIPITIFLLLYFISTCFSLSLRDISEAKKEINESEKVPQKFSISKTALIQNILLVILLLIPPAVLFLRSYIKNRQPGFG